MTILITAATEFEIAPLAQYLKANFQCLSPTHYQNKKLNIYLAIIGVGLTHTAYHLTKVLTQTQADLIINVGIAGSLKPSLHIGEVIEVISEEFADLGVEEADGHFTSMHNLALIPANEHPFQEGKLRNPKRDRIPNMAKASGISVNKVHGYEPSISKLKQQYSADIESMEGAAFFYVCLMEKVDFLAIRSISNFVEARNRDHWDLPLAIGNLNEEVIKFIMKY